MYDYDIFVSYRRSPNIGTWVQKHLVPRLQSRMDESPRDKLKYSATTRCRTGQIGPRS